MMASVLLSVMCVDVKYVRKGRGVFYFITLTFPSTIMERCENKKLMCKKILITSFVKMSRIPQSMLCMCMCVCVWERERERWHLQFKKNVSPSTQNHILTSYSTGGSGDWHHLFFFFKGHAYVTQTPRHSSACFSQYTHLFLSPSSDITITWVVGVISPSPGALTLCQYSVFCSMSAFREEGRLDWLVEEASSPSSMCGVYPQDFHQFWNWQRDQFLKR